MDEHVDVLGPVISLNQSQWEDLSDLMDKGEGKSFVQSLVEAGHDVAAIESGAYSILSIAAEFGDHNLVEYLIEKGADPDDGCFKEYQISLDAAGLDEEDVEEVCLKSRVHVTQIDLDRNTHMHRVTIRGHAGDVKSLLDKVRPVKVVKADVDTPIIQAVRNGKENVVSVLVNGGADFTRLHDDGRTVLWYALIRGWLSVIRSLAEKGVDFNRRTTYGEIPLLLALRESKKDIVHFLLKWGANLKCTNGNGENLLHFTRSDEWYDLAQAALVSGCDVNANDQYGYSPLHCACGYYIVTDSEEFTCIKIVEMYVQNGADVNSKNGFGETPLSIACDAPRLRREEKVIELLLKSGADCNLEGRNGRSLFDDLVHKKDLEMIYMCIETKTYFNEELNPLFKGILQDVDACSRLLVNKFNNRYLPLLYEINGVPEALPSMKDMEIADETNTMELVQNDVKLEIQEKGYYNVFRSSPIVLKMLTVKSILATMN